MTFAEALLVTAENQRHMRKPRDRCAERLKQQNVLRRVGDVVVAANDIGNSHLNIVHDDREVIGRIVVRPEDYEVFDIGAVELDPAVHRVIECGASRGHLEANRSRRRGILELAHLIGGESEARAVVLPGLTKLLGAFALLTKPLRAAEAGVGVSGIDEAASGRAVAVEPLRLEIRSMRSSDFWSFVPCQPKPAQTVEDAGDHVGRRSLNVRVFDAQQKGAAVTAGIEPIEERCARAADVQVAGWRWCEANPRGHPTILSMIHHRHVRQASSTFGGSSWSTM